VVARATLMSMSRRIAASRVMKPMIRSGPPTSSTTPDKGREELRSRDGNLDEASHAESRRKEKLLNILSQENATYQQPDENGGARSVKDLAYQAYFIKTINPKSMCSC
jgi:hypothetical protein